MAATTMYTCPRYTDHNPEIPLPTCMYEMKNVQSSMGCATEERNKEQVEPPEIAKLLQRQLKILEDLEKIKIQVGFLEKKAGTKNEATENEAKIGKEKAQIPPTVQDEDLDIVITAKPSNPPISAFILFNYLKQQGIRLSSACHLHSNLKGSVPYDLMKRIGWQDSVVQSHNKLNFTFIWKEDPFGPSIIVNPRIQTAIKGDANIARFLCRKFAPGLYESLGENGISIIDFLLDLATSKINSGNAEDAKKAFAEVEKQLGSSDWLVDDKFSIADVVIFSAIKTSRNSGLLSHKLQTWFKSIESKFF